MPLCPLTHMRNVPFYCDLSFLHVMENVNEELGLCPGPLCGLLTADLFQCFSGFVLVGEMCSQSAGQVVGSQPFGFSLDRPRSPGQGFVRLSWVHLTQRNSDVSSPINTDLVFLTSYMWFGNAWPFDPQRLKFLLAHEFLGEMSSYETSGSRGLKKGIGWS